MADWGFSCGLEATDQKHQGQSGQCDPANDAEAIHEGQEADLMLELLIEVRGCRARRIRSRKSLLHQMIRERSDLLCELL